MIKRATRFHRQGMTLIEILAALAVMSAMLVPLMLIIRYSSTTTYRSSNDIVATSLAMSKMEELKSYPFFQLENILLGLNPDDPYRIEHPEASRYLRGPFETWPERPDVVEENLYHSGNVVFHRYTYLSYFPQPNPNPNAQNFESLRKRIKIRVHLFWKDRLSNTVSIPQDLAFEAIVHDENYNPKPLFNQFIRNPSP